LATLSPPREASALDLLEDPIDEVETTARGREVEGSREGGFDGIG
jgi:hypothetical protein